MGAPRTSGLCAALLCAAAPAPALEAHTDKRLFIADCGNCRLLSVEPGCRAEERVTLKDVAERTK